MKNLSLKQEKILEFIRRFLSENSYPPTIRDIVRGVGISSTSVADYNLEILQKEGYLRRHHEVSRGIELLDGKSGNSGVLVPIIGQIAAGEPIPVPAADAWNNVSSADTLEVSNELIGKRENVYALKVKGLSMIDALIDDGDTVLLQQTSTVENGEMAAVWLKSEKTATLKKVYANPNRVRLQPANSQMQPILVNPDNIEIQGKVIAVIRRLT
jgi:repressor LexA